jgi:hypothetical protein
MIFDKTATMVILCFLTLTLAPHPELALSDQKNKAWSSDSPYFVPYDITLNDDGFNATLPLHLETWYYEAMSYNNWSVVFIITVLADGRNQGGLALCGLYFYNQGILVAAERIVTREFQVSVNGPECTLNNQHMVTADINSDGKLQYQITAQVNKCQLDITMINQTKGWQGNMGKGWWLAVPHLTVKGTLLFDGEEIIIAGTGYHDHNRFALITPFLESGYMDGKMIGDNFSLVWGHIMHTPRTASSFAIYSEGGTYRALYPPELKMEFDDYVYDHGYQIPKTCQFHFSDDLLTISMTMVGTTYHHIRLPGLRYWRFHVGSKGHLASPIHNLAFDEQGMMERMVY